MANVIIRDSERREREEKVLRDFGMPSENASKEMREHAEHVAEKSWELAKKQQ